jgi:demethylmenaquinone methyltransferase/2-methoxy-6-polyprenyl-1,4-benzoquinol methylase
MFSAIAWRYDLANRVISLGQDQRWRRALADAALARGARNVLDCACGSGDVVLELARQLVRQPGGSVTGVDFSPRMLELAERKAARCGPAGCFIEYAQADILALPFPDASLDACTIAFGVRNLEDPRAGIREMARVLKPGAPLCILETGRPPCLPLAWLHRFYSRYIVPPLGGLISGNFRAYSYLNRTASTFPSGAEFVALLEDCAVFSSISARPLSGGVVWLYVGTLR